LLIGAEPTEMEGGMNVMLLKTQDVQLLRDAET
jgi:hypothetical protein